MMRTFSLIVFGLVMSGVSVQAGAFLEAVSDAISILDAKQNSGKPIPPPIMQHAKAVGFIEVTKGAFGVGGADGEGVILVRTQNGWSAPIAFEQGGGSVGFQIGVDVKKYIYIFNTDGAWRAFAGESKVKFKAAAEATAGPDAVATEASDGLPPIDLYVYTLSGGAFAGAAIGGQMVGNSRDTNRDTYGTSNVDDIINIKIAPPYLVQKLYDALNQASH